MTPIDRTPHDVVLRRGRTRVQNLVEAVLAGGESEDMLDLVLGTARSDLRGCTSLLILPLQRDRWYHEMVTGRYAPELLGDEVPSDSPLGHALTAADPDAIERTAQLPISGSFGPALPALMATVDAADAGYGVLAVLRPHPSPDEDAPDGSHPTGADRDAASPHGTDPTATHDDVPLGGISTAPFDAADRERLDALAALVELTLRLPALQQPSQLEDERSRIARDLHDLAIQELFAVGMELETLRDSLTREDDAPSEAAVRASVSSSITGVENAVAQIREIVQSLRRERSEATLTERLRHEVGIATAGLGFVPTLRLPARAADLDLEVPPEIAEDVVAVVRECLANAARHAHATAVACTVALITEGVDRVLQVNVSDNGRGIDPSVSRRSGLANMSSRARRHNGWVDAFNLEPGTMIAWRVTLPPEE
ncbi:sensor histidine kinase [Brachybacterium timonense]|uniref:sensor histidine kinase n=1 Tax=Brachybacterium timonense TaxID=2050896 RepID=UPI001FEBA834|nr:histidine kinase [Brachybacterium timonense]